MKKEDLDELKNLLENYKEKGIRYGKPLKLLLERNDTTEEEVNKELFSLINLEHIEKQEKDGEIRYVLFFVYNKRRGRQYVLTFREKIIVVTLFPFGRKTLLKYRKRRFIKFKRII